MYGLAQTLFSSPTLVAFNLIQNSIDEAKGAARIAIIAERYASGPLRQEMNRHIAEEMKHSRQFMRLIPLTGLDVEPTEFDLAALLKVFQFDDELDSFLCRVHSIEVRSWTMLRTYIEVLEGRPDDSLDAAIPVLRQILHDEMGHVLYTGTFVMKRLDEHPGFSSTFENCLKHTNHETWADIASMSSYLADNYSSAFGDIQEQLHQFAPDSVLSGSAP